VVLQRRLSSSRQPLRAIADYLAIPLAKLPPEQLEWINTLVETTLNKKEVIEQVEEYFGRRTERESPC
jgi:hypothetical protein